MMIWFTKFCAAANIVMYFIITLFPDLFEVVFDAASEEGSASMADVSDGEHVIIVMVSFCAWHIANIAKHFAKKQTQE